MGKELAQHYAKIRADLRSKGLHIGSNDLWIGPVRSLNKTLVTNKVKEFEGVRGLSIENWCA